MLSEFGETIVGMNDMMFTEIAEYFPNQSKLLVSSVNAATGEFGEGYLYDDYNIPILTIYDEANGLPNKLLHKQQLSTVIDAESSMIYLNYENNIFIRTPTGEPITLEINGNFFVGFNLDYYYSDNEFSLYSVPSDVSTRFFRILSRYCRANQIFSI